MAGRVAAAAAFARVHSKKEGACVEEMGCSQRNAPQTCRGQAFGRKEAGKAVQEVDAEAPAGKIQQGFSGRQAAAALQHKKWLAHSGTATEPVHTGAAAA